MYEKNFLGEYVEYFREVLDNRIVMTFGEFFQYILLPRLKDKDKGARYLRLWSDTINELEPQVKELVLYNLKLDLERRMERQVEFYKNYEQVRFAIRDKPHMIAIEGRCKQCNHAITFPISLRMYNERMAYAHIIPLVIKCRNCQKKDSLRLPYLI
jgi:ribosomal protein L44E